MNIAMFGQKGIPVKQGGVERHVEELSVRLAKQTSIDVYVYTRPRHTKTTKRSHKGVYLIPIKSLPTKHLEAATHTLGSLLHALFVLRPDMYHFHGIGPGLFTWIPRVFAPRARVVGTIHAQDYLQPKWGRVAKAFLRRGERTLVRWSHETIVVSSALQKHIKKTYGATAAIIPNGAQVPVTRKTTQLRRHGLKRNNYLVVIARLTPVKRIEEVIAAYRNTTIHLPLVIVGGEGADTDYKEELLEAAQDDPRVRFLGVQAGEALAQLMRNARLFISASQKEGLPIAVLEAASVGTPLALSSILEHKAVIQSDEARWFTVGNTNELAAALQKAMRYDTSKKAKQRREALRKRVQKTYRWDAVARATQQLYERAQEEKSVDTSATAFSLAQQ